MKVVNKHKQNLAIIALMIATFLNPLGYDVLFKMILDLVGSYWTTIGIFYLGSALFFGLYFWLSGKKPIKYLVNIIRSKLDKIKKNGK